MIAPPATSVVEAFGLSGVPERTHTSRVWRIGNAAVKQVDDPAATQWMADLLKDRQTGPGFRLPRPLSTRSGKWIVDGWAASEWVAGSEDGSRWRDILRTGDAFHDWLAPVSRPDWLDDADDAWRASDRYAWGEQTIEIPAAFEGLVDDLVALRTPVEVGSQLIHGDLTGNVLFDPDGGRPWIIDLSLYWRPPGYAAAIVAVDGHEWEGVDRSVLDAVAARPDGMQMLVRAALFRTVRAAMVPWSDPSRRVTAHRRTLGALREMLD